MSKEEKKEQEQEQTQEQTALATMPMSLGSLAASNSGDILSLASGIATQLMPIVEANKLYVSVSGRKYLLCEGWTALLSLMGIVPICERVEALPTIEAPTYWEATVKLVRVSDQAMVGMASAICSKDEPQWKSRLDFQCRSMAITRAVSKAARLSFSWIIQLDLFTQKGYAPTPAEEMVGISNGNGAAQATRATPPDLVPFTGGNDKPDESSQRQRANRKKVVSKPVKKAEPAKPKNGGSLQFSGTMTSLDERAWTDKEGERRPIWFLTLREADASDDAEDIEIGCFSETIGADLQGWGIGAKVTMWCDAPRAGKKNPTVRRCERTDNQTVNVEDINRVFGPDKEIPF